MSDTLKVVTLLGSLRKGSFNGMVARTLPGIAPAGMEISALPSIEQPLSGKPVLIQTSSMGAIGGARCQYHLRQILVFLDAMVMNKPEFMGGVIQNKVDPQSGEVVDQSTLDHLSGQLSAFAEYIQRVKA